MQKTKMKWKQTKRTKLTKPKWTKWTKQMKRMKQMQTRTKRALGAEDGLPKTGRMSHRLRHRSRLHCCRQQGYLHRHRHRHRNRYQHRHRHRNHLCEKPPVCLGPRLLVWVDEVSVPPGQDAWEPGSA